MDTLDHPGIVYRGSTNDRRAALAAGPDVWEVVARLRELKGSEEKRIATLAEESELHPRQIRTAIDCAAEHREQIESRIRRNDKAAETSRRAAEEREALLTRLLLDEMFPLRAAELLRETHGQQAAHVGEFGLDATAAIDIATFARANDWAVVTENVTDFNREPDLVLVFVLKRNLPAGSPQATALAELLDHWVREHPDPYVGTHWPT